MIAPRDRCFIRRSPVREDTFNLKKTKV